MSDSLVTAALMIFGGAGFLGSLAFSRYYSRNRKAFITWVVALMVVCLLLLTPTSFSTSLLIVVCAVWGMAATAYNVAMQSNIILITTPESTSVAMSIFSGIFNLGIGSGAFFGGQICDHVDISYIGYAGAILGFIALIYWIKRLGTRV